MDNLDGKTAVITGAASGIGLALAHQFGAAGMNLVLGDIERPALDAAEAALADAGYPVAAMELDVRELDEIRAFEAFAREQFGNVHVLCNNAGVGGGGPVAGADDIEMWRWVIDIDLWGVIYGCKVFLPAMIEHGESAHVVNTASMAGLTSMPGMGSYCVSKYGVVALSETLALEMQMGATNVGVSVLCPAFVKTGIANSGRNLPAELATTVAEPVEGGMQGIIEKLVDNGISTDIVGAAVLDAVKQNTFWILTHDEMKPTVIKRSQDIVDGVNPQLQMPPT